MPKYELRTFVVKATVTIVVRAESPYYAKNIAKAQLEKSKGVEVLSVDEPRYL